MIKVFNLIKKKEKKNMHVYLLYKKIDEKFLFF